MFIVIVLILLIFSGSVFYAADQAKKIDAVMIDARNTYPGIDNYFAVVESLHYKALQESYDETAKEVIGRLPPSFVARAQFLKTFDVKSAASSLEKELDQLTKKVRFIDPSLALLPSRSWIYRYSNTSKLSTQRLPSYAMQAIYYMRPRTDTYSIENLIKVFEYRNLAVQGCNRYVQSIFNSNLSAAKECDRIKTTLMEKDWQQWFNASKEKNYLLPRLKDSLAQIATFKNASLRVCNLAPYRTRYIIEYSAEDGPANVKGWYELDPGGCETHEEQFIDTEPAFWVHLRTADRPRFERITEQIRDTFIRDADLKNDRYAREVATEYRNTTQCVSNAQLNFRALISENGACPSERPFDAGFIMAMSKNESREEWHFFAEHRNLTHFDPSELVSDPRVHNSAREYAKMLSQAIVHQEAFERGTWQNAAPFSLGATIVDYNGPLNQGVKLINVASRSIDDVPLPYHEGDTLVSLNGHIVFGASDVNHWLNEHGFSRSGGYDVPLTVVLKRGSEMAEYRVSYFFGPSHPLFDLVSEGRAASYGIGDMAALGTSAGVTCSAANGLRVTANVFLWIGNVLGSLNNDTSSSSQKPYTELEDMSECLWRVNQLKAIAKQRYKGTYDIAGWMALALPSPLRMIALEENGGLGLASGLFGKGALKEARIAAIEVGLWTLGTSAPEQTWHATIDRAKEMATMGAGIGFVVGALSGR